MNKTELVIQTDVGRVRVLTLNRPDSKNALNDEMLDCLLLALARSGVDPKIRCVVLKGSAQVFCAGGDVEHMSRLGEDTRPRLEGMAMKLGACVMKILTMPKPFIVLADGAVAGGAISLLLAADYRIAGDKLLLAVGYPGVGLTPDGGLSWLLPKIVGLSKARELFLVSQRIDAAKALELGLVQQIVPSEVMEGTGLAFADRLAEGPVGAFSETRRLFLQGYNTGFPEHFAEEARTVGIAGASPEGKEGMGAFRDRRKPVYTFES